VGRDCLGEGFEVDVARVVAPEQIVHFRRGRTFPQAAGTSTPATSQAWRQSLQMRSSTLPMSKTTSWTPCSLACDTGGYSGWPLLRS
jgi:hypothetical protein